MAPPRNFVFQNSPPIALILVPPLSGSSIWSEFYKWYQSSEVLRRLVTTFRKLFVIIILLFLLFKAIAEKLSKDKIKGFIQMFSIIDTDIRGSVTYEELKTGLATLGSKLNKAEVKQLMDAVRYSTIIEPLSHHFSDH